MLGEALTALGAAGEGALEGYTWAHGQKLQREEIASRERIAKMNADVRQLLIDAGVYKNDANIESREKIAGGNNATKKEIAGENNATRRTVAELAADTRSRIAEMVEAGKDSRFDKGITARSIWNERTDATRRRGQDAMVRGQDVARDVAVMRDDTSRARTEVEAAAPRRQERSAGAAERSGIPLPGYEDRGVASTRPDDVPLSTPPALSPRRALPGRPWPPSDASAAQAGPSMRDISDLRSQGVDARTAIDQFASRSAGDDFARGVRAAGVWPPSEAASAEEPSGRDAGGDRAQAAAVVTQLRNAIDAVKAARTPEERKRATETLRRLRGEVRR